MKQQKISQTYDAGQKYQMPQLLPTPSDIELVNCFRALVNLSVEAELLRRENRNRRLARIKKLASRANEIAGREAKKQQSQEAAE